MIELSELRDSAQKAFPADKLKPPREASWQLAAEMGWLMMPVPEDQGGLGLGLDAIVTIHFEMGRILGSAPLVPALMTIRALTLADNLPDRSNWIERTCAGEFITSALGLKGPALVAAADGTRRLGGTLEAVFDADMASHLLVITEGRLLCALIPCDAPGVTVRERPLWDESRRLFDVTLTAVKLDPALVLAEGGAVKPIARALKTDMLTALAADSLGGANAALDMAIEYLKTRKQFDRPLAMFQALKHRCADLKTQIAGAEALLWARAADAGATVTDLGALKALASDVYRIVTEEAIQLHGGIGLTEEHNCHLFMKRAMLNLQLGGDADQWREAAGRQALASIAPA